LFKPEVLPDHITGLGQHLVKFTSASHPDRIRNLFNAYIFLPKMLKTVAQLPLC